MENRFSTKMAQQTDAALLKIVNERRGDYEPEAIIAAENELEKRGLSVEQVDQALQQNITEAELINERSNEPLGMVWKVLGFFFPGILILIISGSLKADGYDKKAKDLFIASMYGIGFYLALGIACTIF